MLLIPTVIALSSFFAQNFPGNFSWYPYWYLGNPYRFLIGPVVPAAITLVQSSKFKVQSFDIYTGLILLSLLLGAFGIYLLLREWGTSKRQSFMSSILYLVLPASFFLLRFQNGLNHIAFGFLPFVFILYRRFLKKPRVNIELFLSILIAFILLIDVSILLPLIVGFTALIITEEKRNVTEDQILKTSLLILLGISVSSIWYTPRFWLTILSNPSFGGMPLINLALFLFKFILNFIPILLAIMVARWRKFKLKGYLAFAYLFFISFLFLSIVRFLSNPKFVMDWISFGLELQFGLAIILGNLGLIFWRSPFSKFSIIAIIAIVLLFDCSIVGVNSFWPFNNVTMRQRSNVYQNRIISMLSYVPKNERVFLSGSSVFWLNSYLNIAQVRGGADEASIHPFWADGAFQIREGTNPKLTLYWLKAFGVSYILVNDKGSSEPFHDFKYPYKFKEFQKATEKEGDVLYKIEDSSIARLADKQILKVPRPRNGGDFQTLAQYAFSLKKPAQYFYEKPNQIDVQGQVKENEVFSLAVTYDPRWSVTGGRGQIYQDGLGNIVIAPSKNGEENFKLTYELFWYDTWIPVIASFLLGAVLIYFSKIFPYLKKSFSGLHIGLSFDEDEY